MMANDRTHFCVQHRSQADDLFPRLREPLYKPCGRAPLDKE
jgi:hypothetical protein